MMICFFRHLTFLTALLVEVNFGQRKFNGVPQ